MSEADNTCNLFVGDSLFPDGKTYMRGGKYYSANEIYNGINGLTRIASKDVARGDIAVWIGHVEIVVSVDRVDDSYCTRGGYRRTSEAFVYVAMTRLMPRRLARL